MLCPVLHINNLIYHVISVRFNGRKDQTNRINSCSVTQEINKLISVAFHLPSQ